MRQREVKNVNLYRKSLFNLLLELDENLDSNYKKIIEFYETNDIDLDDELYLLNFSFPEDLYFPYIETILNAKKIKYPEEIIRILINRNCTIETIKRITNLIRKYDYNLDFNSKMDSGETYGDYFIYSLCKANSFRLIDIYNLLKINGYKPTNVFISDETVKSFIDKTSIFLIKFQEDLCDRIFADLRLSSDEFQTLRDNGIILNSKFYVGSQAIGRERELENLVISLAQDKKCPILVGESGVGKTAIVDELIYRIKTNNVPKFLYNQLIYEFRVDSAIAGTRYRGDFEKKVKQIFKICLEHHLIVFIDEIHTIYGLGAADESHYDLASIIKTYIDRDNLRVIGTTTDIEYDKYFASDALKRRFDKIKIKEPEYNIMYEIALKVINDYSIKSGISSEKLLENNSRIIDIILEATCSKHRTYDDVVNNPDLTVSIIDKAFAYAKVFESEELEINHLIKSFEMCDRIYEITKDKAIESLNALSSTNEGNKKQYIKMYN